MHTLLSAWRALAHSRMRHLFLRESAVQDVSLFLDWGRKEILLNEVIVLKKNKTAFEGIMFLFPVRGERRRKERERDSLFDQEFAKSTLTYILHRWS